VSVAQEQSAWLVAAGQPRAVRRTVRMQARVGGGDRGVPFRNARRLCATRYDPMDVGTAVGLGGRTGGTGRGGEAVVWIRWRVVCCITWYWYSSTRSYGQSSGTALGQLPPTLRLLWLLLLSQDPRAPCTYCCCCSAVLLLDKRAGAEAGRPSPVPEQERRRVTCRPQCVPASLVLTAGRTQPGDQDRVIRPDTVGQPRPWWPRP